MSKGGNRNENNGLISRIRLVLLLMGATAIIIYLSTPTITDLTPIPERLLTGIGNSLLIGGILGSVVHVYLEKARRKLVREEFEEIVDQNLKDDIERLKSELTTMIEESVHEHASKIDASIEMEPAALIEEIEEAAELYFIGQVDINDFTIQNRELPDILREKFSKDSGCEVLYICDLDEEFSKKDNIKRYENIFQRCDSNKNFRMIDIGNKQIINAVIIDEKEVIYFAENTFDMHQQDKIIKVTSEDTVSSLCDYVDLKVETEDNIINSRSDLSKIYMTSD